MQPQNLSKLMEISHLNGVIIVMFLSQKILEAQEESEEYIGIVGEKLHDLIDNEGKISIIFDLSNLETGKKLSKVLMNKILFLKKSANHKDSKVVFFGLKENHLNFFRTTKFDQFFIIANDKEDALSKFAKSGG